MAQDRYNQPYQDDDDLTGMNGNTMMPDSDGDDDVYNFSEAEMPDGEAENTTAGQAVVHMQQPEIKKKDKKASAERPEKASAERPEKTPAPGLLDKQAQAAEKKMSAMPSYMNIDSEANPTVSSGVVTGEAVKQYPWLAGYEGTEVFYDRRTGKPVVQYVRNSDGSLVDSKTIADEQAAGASAEDYRREPAAPQLADVNIGGVDWSRDRAWLDGRTEEILKEMYDQFTGENGEIEDDGDYNYQGKAVKGSWLKRRIMDELRPQARQAASDTLNDYLSQIRKSLLMMTDGEREDQINSLYRKNQIPPALSKQNIYRFMQPTRQEQIDYCHDFIRDLQRKREAIKDAINRRGAELDKNGWDALADAATGGVRANDTRWQQLHVALKENENAEARIRSVIDELKGGMTFSRAMADAFKASSVGLGSFDFGMSDFGDMMTTLYTVNELEGGSGANEAGYWLLQSLSDNQTAQGIEGGNTGMLYNSVKGGIESAPFTLQFMVGSEFVEALSKGAAKLGKKAAYKALKKEAYKSLYKAMDKRALKMTGMLAETVLKGALMSGTVQALNTAKSVGEQYVGSVSVDGGQYQRAGKSLGGAMYVGTVGSVIENQTEYLGELFPGVLDIIKKIGGTKYGSKFGLGNLAEWLEGLGQKELFQTIQGWARRGGIQGLGGEYLEEFFGTLENAALTGESEFSDLVDPDQQLLTFNTVLMSCVGMGLFGTGMHLAGKGVKGVRYTFDFAKYKQLESYNSRWDGKADEAFGEEAWAKLKDEIDETQNGDMTALEQRIRNDQNLTKDQRHAAVNYIHSLMVMRGTHIAMMKAEKEGLFDKENMKRAAEIAAGYNAEGNQRHLIQLDFESARKDLADRLGMSEEELEKLPGEQIDDYRENWDDETKEKAQAYETARNMARGAENKGKEVAAAAAANARDAARKKVNDDKGTVQTATIQGMNSQEGHDVYIVGNNLERDDDGTVNRQKSDKVIYYYDETDGEIHAASADMFLSVGEEQDGDSFVQEAEDAARKDAEEKDRDSLDGGLEIGGTYEILDEAGNKHEYKILSQFEGGLLKVSVDGKVTAMSVEGLEKVKDVSDAAQVAAAKAQREQQRQAAGQAETEAQTGAEADEQTAATVEDNLDYSEIIDENGEISPVAVYDNKDNPLYDGQDVFLVQGKRQGKPADILKIAVADDSGNVTTKYVRRSQVDFDDKMTLQDYKSMRRSRIGADTQTIQAAPVAETRQTAPTDVEAGTQAQQTAAPEQVSQEAEEAAPQGRFRDGTAVPVDEEGNVDLSSADAAHAAEWYHDNLGENAAEALDGNVERARQRLEEAGKMKVEGETPSEQKASSDAKRSAVDEARREYDKAKAVKAAYEAMAATERQAANTSPTAVDEAEADNAEPQEDAKLSKKNTRQNGRRNIAPQRQSLAGRMAENRNDAEAEQTEEPQEQGSPQRGRYKYDVTTKEGREKLIAETEVTADQISEDKLPAAVRNAIQAIAGYMGVKVRWLDTAEMESNGFFIGGTIFLSTQPQKAISFVFGHEMLHDVRKKSEATYNKMTSLVKSIVGQAAFMNKLYDEIAAYRGLQGYNTLSDFEEEAVADILGDVINDNDLLERLASGLAKTDSKFVEWFKSAVNRIKEFFVGVDYYERYLDNVVKMIDDAYREAKEEADGNRDNGAEDNGTQFSLRQKPDPKKTVKVYKLMRLGEDGKSVSPLYIGSGEAMELGKWYDADSPALADLKKLPSGSHLVSNSTGEAMSIEDFKAAHPEMGRMGSKPSVKAVNWATANGCRWISVRDKEKGQGRYGGEQRSYYNYGINGSGTVGEFAMRPGWHAGSLPTMRQIGKGKDRNLRDDSFVWVEGEMAADKDYNAEAQRNADKDIPDHIPEDGFYMKSTNADSKAAQADKVGWYVSGSFKPVRIMSDSEADAVVDEWNAGHPDEEPVEKDYRRESGKVFNAETMRLEEAGGNAKYSLGQATGKPNATISDSTGEAVAVTDSNDKVKLSQRTFNPWTDNYGRRHEGTRAMLLDYLKDSGASEEEIKDFADEMDYWSEYLKKIADFRNPDGTFKFKAFHDWNLKQPQYRKVGSKIEKAVSTAIQNGEYAVNQELSTDCIKREAFTKLVNTLAARGADLTDMGPRQIAVIKDMMRKHGVQVACDLCFVEGKRLGIVNWANTIVTDWNRALEAVGLKPDELEPFNFGGYARDAEGNLIDDAVFVPTEELGSDDATQWKAVNEVFDILGGRDKAYYDDMKKRNVKNWIAWRNKNMRKWDAYKQLKKEGKRWNDKYLTKDQKAIKASFLTYGVDDPQHIYRNSMEYAEAYRKMEKQYLAKHPDGVFEPNATQQNKLDNIRNKNIDKIFGKMQRLIAEHPEMRKRMQLSDLLGSKGLMQIRQENGEAHAQLWSILLGRFGSGTPKPIQDAVPYSGEVYDITDGLLSDAYAEGGARMFSFSDFDITKVFDIMQIVWDMAARGMKLQSYSKEAAYVTMFGKQNIKINISTLPKAVMPAVISDMYRNAKKKKQRAAIRHMGAENAGLKIDESGRIVDMGWSEEHSAKPDFCMQIFKDPERNGSCGAITVGASVNHSIWAAGQDWIRMVIPFHLSGMPIAARERTDVKWYYDNTPYQNTRVPKKGKNGTEYVSVNSDYAKDMNTKRKSEGLPLIEDYNFYASEGENWDMRTECREYVKWCEERGYLPKFDWGINSDRYRQFCEREGYTPNPQIIEIMDGNMTDGVWNGYYKFITDFNCYKPVLDENGEPVHDENGHLVETVAHHLPVKRGISLTDAERKAIFGDADGTATDLGDSSVMQNRTNSIANANGHMDDMAREAMDYLMTVHKQNEGKASDAEVEEAEAMMKGEGGKFFDSTSDADLLMKAGAKFSLRSANDSKAKAVDELREGLAGIDSPERVDRAVSTAVESMPKGWREANPAAVNIMRALAESRKAELSGGTEAVRFSLPEGKRTLINGGTYFSGGGLVEEGLRGIMHPAFAVEYDEKISGVYRDNFGNHIVTADVRDVDPKKLASRIDGEVGYFHASPVCKNYSRAKLRHEEVELDKETAASTAEFIEKARPKVVTVENVKGYRDSEAMKIITDALDKEGYAWDANVYNAADYGAYTNRERLIVRAVRDGNLPPVPEKQARKGGWFEAVEDIIETMPEKKNGIAPWMDERLKADGIDWRNIDKPLYVMGSGYANGTVPHAFADELLPTLRTKSGDVIVMPDGKVYRAMGRVIARISGMGDDYRMPSSEALSHTIVGNGVPVQLTRGVIAPLIEQGGGAKFSIRTYHGSAADFDHFDHSHMGEGEGAQAYGWGTYVTEVEGIGKTYAKANTAKNIRGGGFMLRVRKGAKEMELDELESRAFRLTNEIKSLKKEGDSGVINDYEKELESTTEKIEKVSSEIEKLKDDIKKLEESARNLYTVDIPDDTGDNYLSWNEPLTDEQIIKIQEYLSENYSQDKAGDFKASIAEAAEWTRRGERVYKKLKSLLGSDKKASLALSEAGFTGIKYPADYRRGGRKDGAKNYVIFNESDAQITGHAKFSLRNGADDYSQRLSDWKQRNGLDPDAEPLEKPEHKEGESATDYMNRVVEWTKNKNLWKTAPKPIGYTEALEQWKKDHGIAEDEFPPTRPRRQDYETDEEYDEAYKQYANDREKWEAPVHPDRHDYETDEEYYEAVKRYDEAKERWTEPPKDRDYDLSYDMNDIGKRFDNLLKAVKNQRSYDQRTVAAVADLVRDMLALGWGDHMGRGGIKRLLSAAKNVTGEENVRKYVDKAMSILTDNYLKSLQDEYNKILNTKDSKLDQTGVVKMGQLDAVGQGFLKEYRRALQSSEEDQSRRIAQLDEDSYRNPAHKEGNEAMQDGIAAAQRFRETIGQMENDISDLKSQIMDMQQYNADHRHSEDPQVKEAVKMNAGMIRAMQNAIAGHKRQLVLMYNDHLNMMDTALWKSRDRAHEFRQKVKERKGRVLDIVRADMHGLDASNVSPNTLARKFWENPAVKIAMSSAYSFEQYMKLFGYVHNATGEGYMYDYFMTEWYDAITEQQTRMEEHRKALDEKASEIFGKKVRFNDLIGLTGKRYPTITAEVVDLGSPTGKRQVKLTQGQLLYIYLCNKETDGRMKLEAMGISSTDVERLADALDPRFIELGEWLQDEYLPEQRARYQDRHVEFFGAPMREVDHYYPLRVNQRAVTRQADVSQTSSQRNTMVSTATGAIVTRRINTTPLDIESTDAFAALLDNLSSMEEWSAMLPFRTDINTILSSTEFANQVKNMSSKAYGNGESLWNQFEQCAQIAAGTYRPRTDNESIDKRFMKALGLVSMAKISWRLWTAFKQTLSVPAFLTETDTWRFAKNSINPYGSYKWAYENLPIYRKRVESMAIGDTRIKELLDNVDKTKDFLVSIGNKGMIPNVFVDAVTCAVGARSVYESELHRLMRLGYPSEQAKKKALLKAGVSYNRSQQSSEGAFVSPLQVDRTYLSSVLSLFKNSPYSYGRNIIDAVRGLSRTMPLWNNNKNLAIDSIAKQIEEQDGLDEETARRVAKDAYKRTRAKSIGTILNYFTIMPILWNLGSNVLYCLFGDDDDKKKDMLADAAVKGFLTTVTDDYAIPFVSDVFINAPISFANGEFSYDMKQIGESSLYKNPATSDIANMLGNFSKGNYFGVLNRIGDIGVQAMTGFNPQTLGNVIEAFSEWDGSGDMPTEAKIALMKALNAPEDNVRNLLIDELGLNRKEAGNVTVYQLERRYAERQMNRQNGLTKYLMSTGAYNELVDKYAKSFEARIKEYMDRLDDRDSKRTDHIYDESSDPAIRDMIAKKRKKDVEKKADEQMKKENVKKTSKTQSQGQEWYERFRTSYDLRQESRVRYKELLINRRMKPMKDKYSSLLEDERDDFRADHPDFDDWLYDMDDIKLQKRIISDLVKEMGEANGDQARYSILKEIREERKELENMLDKLEKRYR